MELTTMQHSDKAWVWYAIDFAEGIEKEEKFAIRFKLADTAKQFKEKFIEGKIANSELGGKGKLLYYSMQVSGILENNFTFLKQHEWKLALLQYNLLTEHQKKFVLFRVNQVIMQ